MPDLKMSLGLSIDGGPSWNINSIETIEAYDVIDVTIDPATTDKPIQIQPATAARVNVLAIQSSLYGAEITYKVTDTAGDSVALTLFGAHFFSRGTVALFDHDAFGLKLSNANAAGSGKQARIQILVGRDATP